MHVRNWGITLAVSIWIKRLSSSKMLLTKCTWFTCMKAEVLTVFRSGAFRCSWTQCQGRSSNLRVILLATFFFLISMGKVIRLLPNNLKTIFKIINKRKMFKTMSQSRYDWTFQQIYPKVRPGQRNCKKLKKL